MYAVFCCPIKGNSEFVAPLDFGLGNEPTPHLLLRRGRVGMFATRGEAVQALKNLGKECAGMEFLKTYKWIIIECKERALDLSAHKT